MLCYFSESSEFLTLLGCYTYDIVYMLLLLEITCIQTTYCVQVDITCVSLGLFRFLLFLV